MTQEQKKVRDILVEYGPASHGEGRDAPIHEVGRAMNWEMSRTLAFVSEMESRGLLQLRPIVGHGPEFDGRTEWVSLEQQPVA